MEPTQNASFLEKRRICNWDQRNCNFAECHHKNMLKSGASFLRKGNSCPGPNHRLIRPCMDDCFSRKYRISSCTSGDILRQVASGFIVGCTSVPVTAFAGTRICHISSIIIIRHNHKISPQTIVPVRFMPSALQSCCCWQTVANL